MMNKQNKSLLAMLFLGATATVQVMAQDVATALKDVEAERFNKAEKTLTQLVSTSPTAENQFYLGYAYLKSGQIAKAKAAFEKGQAADAKDQLNKVGLAGVALAKKDRATAKSLIDDAVDKTKSKNAEVLLRAGEMYTLSDSTNDPAEAIRLLTIADERDKKNENAQIEMAIGDAYFLKNDGGNAITKYENALTIDPKLAEADYKIGRLYLRGKNYKEAQNFFNKAIEIDPEFAPTYLAFADALASSRAYKGASENYEKYVQKSGTTDPERLLDVARYYFLAQDYQKAITYLDQLKGKINNPIIDRIYGWAYYGMNQPQQSVESLNKFIGEAPTKVIADDYKYLGRAYGMMKNPQGDSLAIAYLEKAAPLDTVDNVYREIAQKYYDIKKYDKAASSYAKAIKNDDKPQNNDFLYMGLANYQYAPRVGRDSSAAPMDTAQIAAGRKMYYMRADSAFAEMAKRIEAIPGKGYPAAYYYRAQSNYYAYPRAEALSNKAAVPYYEKFIAEATTPRDSTDKTDYSKYLVTAYKALAAYAATDKDDAKSKEYLQKVLTIDPNDVQAKEALDPTPKAAPKTAKPAPKTAVKKSTSSK